ncbi:MAG: hypothetical protein K2K55_00390 [Duncaniella sp.]|nr:hypothetical protein [Duncaniella sp.]
MKKIIYLLIFMIIGAADALAQIQDAETIRRRAAEMVGQMNDYITSMADKDKSLKTRQYYRKKALNLFIGKGEPYTIDGKRYKAVSMQTTSVNRPGVKTTPMGDYFTHLINLGYKDVDIKSTEIGQIKVSSLKRISDDTYECTCYIEQEFLGYGADGRPRYHDITKKSVQCFITVEQTVDEPQYIVQLGNVTATETRRL